MNKSSSGTKKQRYLTGKLKAYKNVLRGTKKAKSYLDIAAEKKGVKTANLPKTPSIKKLTFNPLSLITKLRNVMLLKKNLWNQFLKIIKIHKTCY